MVVPNLSVDEQLHVTDAPFDQTPCQQAAPAIGIRGIVPEAVEILRRLGLAGYIERGRR